MKTLKELVLDSSAIAQQLIENNGELTPELETALTENIQNLPSKIDGCQAVLERLENEAAYWKAKSDEFLAVSKTVSNTRERLRDYIKVTMLSNGVKELKGLDTRMCLQNSKPKLLIEESRLPEEYKRQVVSIEIDRDKIIQDLAAGVFVAGAIHQEVFALRSYVNKGQKKIATN